MKLLIDYLAYLLVVTVLAALRLLPRRSALWLATALADFAFLIDHRHRRIGMVNLQVAFPRLSEAKRNIILRGAYHNFARVVVEAARLPKLTPATLHQLCVYDEVNGLTNYQAAKARGQGVLFFTMHYGSWELLPFVQALSGYPLSFVVRPLDNKFVDRLVRESRQRCGNRLIPKHGAVRGLLQELKRGRDVGILVDQNVAPDEGVYANFFGRPASSPSILALLALRTGAPVVPGIIRYNRPRDRYRIIFLPPVEMVQTGDHARDIQLNTERVNQVLEHLIRQKPSQWLWMHRRWKAQPDGIDNPVQYHHARTAS